jgi:hypothetical protein
MKNILILQNRELTIKNMIIEIGQGKKINKNK